MPRLLFNPFTGTFDYVAKPQDRLRVGVELLGVVNGTNVTFTTPNKFVYQPGVVEIAVFLNGQRLTPGVGKDFVATESGGSGSGYDTIVFAVAPRLSGATEDQIRVDYVMR
jgi:hypothetical protein